MKKILFFLFSIMWLFAFTKKETILVIKASKLIEQGYDKKALVILNKILKTHPHNDNLLTLKAQALKDLKKLDEAKIILQKALAINPENKKALALVENIKNIENNIANKVLEDTLNWISDKGVDFLFIFLGFLGGELLNVAYQNCNKLKEQRLILNYTGKKEFTLKSINCIFIDFLIYLTVAFAFTIPFLLVELFIEPPYLKYITEQGLVIHISIVFFIFLLFIFIYNFYKKRIKKTVENEIIADIFLRYLDERNIYMLKQDLKLLNYEQLENILQNIPFEEEKEQIRKIFISLKEKQ